MTECRHHKVRCLNHYDTFRKFECLSCGRVVMCACERELALTFLPHQTRRGQELGTRNEYPVWGFAPDVCPECRGEGIHPHPRSEASRTKGKIARFYWREVFKTYCELISKWASEHEVTFDGLLGFETEYSPQAKKLQAAARKHWQEVHRRRPKYDMREPTLGERIGDTPIPERVFEAAYEKVPTSNSQVGKWRSATGSLVSAEEIARERFLELGYDVVRCERRIISAWVATFLCHPVQRSDNNVVVSYRRSTRGWSPQNPDTPIIAIPLPRDFGSPEYYRRRAAALADWIDGLSVSETLLPVFDSLLSDSESLRDYLWANDDDVLDDARAVLDVVPPKQIAAWIRWTIGDFWGRQPGWPDYFVYGGGEFFFSEVKSPHDRMSNEQKRWFEWALREEGIAAEVCRIRKAR